MTDVERIETIIVTGSRIYCPTSDVATKLDSEPFPELKLIHAFGSSPVCHSAIQWAASRGIKYLHTSLHIDRSNLYEAAKEPGAYSILFASRAVNAKGITKGMGEIINHYRSGAMHGVSFDVIQSDIPGRVCELITKMTKHRDEFAAIADPGIYADDQYADSRRRRKNGEYQAAIVASLELRKIYARLKTILDDETGDVDEWTRGLRTLEVIERELLETIRVLNPVPEESAP